MRGPLNPDRRRGRPGGDARPLDEPLQIGANARRGLAGPARTAVDAAGYALGLALAGVAAVRRAKAVHPHGAVYEAELVTRPQAGPLGRTELFGAAGRRRALVRFSRSLGLPRPLPDLLGMSVRVPDAYGSGRHQDLLMVSSVDAPILHHLFVPASDVQQRPYSCSLPYRTDGTTLLLGALPRAESPRPGAGAELDRLAAAAATGALVFDLAAARPWGRFRPVAELRVGDPLPAAVDALGFNPWNCGGGLEPTGVLNRLRDYAYPLSQRAWGRARRVAASRSDLESVRPSTRSRGDRAMSVTDELLKNNEAYAESFDKGDLPLPPAKKLAVVACMDARLIPTRVLGLNEGDAHVIRNAGGVVTDDEIRSLAISQRLLGTEEIILIHHTDCGMLTFTDDEFKRQIQEETGIKPEWAAEAFTDLDEDMRQSIARIKASPFIPHKDSIRGFVYEVETGRLREVT